MPLEFEIVPSLHLDDPSWRSVAAELFPVSGAWRLVKQDTPGAPAPHSDQDDRIIMRRDGTMHLETDQI